MHTLAALRLLPFLILLGCATTMVAQPVAFNDEFTDNRNTWWVGESPNGACSVAGGHYSVSCVRPGSWWYAERPIYIDPKKDYTIEVRIRQNRGSHSGGFGIVFGASDPQNFNQFIISSSGAAAVVIAEGDRWNELLPWTRVEGIAPMRQYNVLTVERRGSRMRYLVNAKEVATSPVVRLHGFDFGVLVSDTMEVEVDRVTIRQEQTINLVPKAPKKVEKVNLGPNVNSEYDELGPIIAPDGKTLYFSVNYHPENTGGTGDADEIWYSEAEAKGRWGKRRRMGPPLNNVQANWVISVTPDNNALLVANLYKPDGSPAGSGISLSRRVADGWSVPREVKIHGFVNNSAWQQFGLSSDRKVLLLSVTGEETHGDHDLYVSFLHEDGTWSRPLNLGPTVNTLGAEGSPFLAADGVTIYYSSNGLPGYGRSDIYVSRRLDDTWTKWSEPQNLGPAINTPADESYFTVPASGTFAYMNSSHKSLGKLDIFRIALPEALRPQPVVLVYGTVLNSKTKAPLGADISYHDLRTNAEIGVASSDPTTGAYKIVLPAGRVYSFLAELGGYYAVSDNLDVKGLTGYRELKRDLMLTPVEVGATIRLNNIFFDFAKSELRGESFPELARAIEFLNGNPNVTIEVGGHTDNVGADADNLALSESRARAVLEYLRAQGIDASRLTSRGYGETKPVASNGTDEGRQRNRRVEFTIVRQ
ncbi:MAG TPA: OmpA family protein [Candidatus Kapabacteria bacterium]|nr:OmpA family protein [Candidatus Kapabacteria bacterium]